MASSNSFDEMFGKDAIRSAPSAFAWALTPDWETLVDYGWTSEDIRIFMSRSGRRPLKVHEELSTKTPLDFYGVGGTPIAITQLLSFNRAPEFILREAGESRCKVSLTAECPTLKLESLHSSRTVSPACIYKGMTQRLAVGSGVCGTLPLVFYGGESQGRYIAVEDILARVDTIISAKAVNSTTRATELCVTALSFAYEARSSRKFSTKEFVALARGLSELGPTSWSADRSERADKRRFDYANIYVPRTILSIVMPREPEVVASVPKLVTLYGADILLNPSRFSVVARRSVLDSSLRLR